ncbi:type VI secretion system ATPase TssH [Pseudomonas sp. CCM 7891]|uniref:Type VI secretion system ATPase TssH n=1 Tax=Pseudomonas karstica TaxID=1055468 RepID=A0A7X2RQ68_9PSED|nr:type VI secretion system ATPase TssH [Pseudomonas karstica]MTD18983.1 type VI secretion system ATPase TssH [Pseudomonas karstica]
MMNVDLQQLIQALAAPSRRTLERAAERCVMRGGAEVLVEDLLLALLEHPDGVLVRALQDAGVAPAELESALQPRSEQVSSSNPVFAEPLVQWLQHALRTAHLELEQDEVDDGALLLALLRNPIPQAGSRYPFILGQIDAERLRSFLLSERPEHSDCMTPVPGPSLLQRFTHDLTRQARDGLLDPVLCRDGEIRQLIDILARRRKNNPIVIGEAGVGKTAIVEGLALRIVAAQVPAVLQNVRLLTLDMGLLQAGASIKGEFERRLKGVIDEVDTSPETVILFIDEAHTLVGAGGQPGGLDAANLLKPALARGELRTIAATTWSEYKKYFEKDPALSRRFQPVHVHEPTVGDAVTILRGLVPVYEASHGIYVRDDAVVAAAQLSARYLSGRQLPDKAVDVLDTACARVRISLVTAPAELQRLRDELAEGSRQCMALRRDVQAGLSVDEPALQALALRLEEVAREHEVLEQRWGLQRGLAEQMLVLRQQLAEAHRDQADAQVIDRLGQVLAESHRTLLMAQREQRLVSFEVCPRLIAQVISAWTGIPVTQLAREHSSNVLGFSGDLRTRILGQDYAVRVLDRCMRAVAAGLNSDNAPVGVFLLVGPSGVGKTETARTLADLLYGGERFMTTINMSEYQEKHSLSRLIGSPPGYVGYGEGGVLTEAVRQKPYSVVLLDEVEKADPDVMNLFYQVFDKGVANDGEGREIDFRNTLILMTSNLGSEQIVTLCSDTQHPNIDVLQKAIQPILSAHFKPALLARIRVVPYYPVNDGVLQELIESKLQYLGQRLLRRNLKFSHSPELLVHMKDRCLQSDSGARFIDHWLEANLLPLVVDRLLEAMAGDEPLQSAHAGLDRHGHLTCEFN